MSPTVLPDELGGQSAGLVNMNGLKICWGRAKIVPVANTMTAHKVTFPIDFDNSPALSIDSVGAGTSVQKLQLGEVTESAAVINLLRTNTTPTWVHWVAVGV